MAKFDRLHIMQKSNLQKKVLKVMHQTARATLIGEIATDLRLSLDMIEDLLLEMADPLSVLNLDTGRSDIERVPDTELERLGISLGVVAYRLTVPPSMRIAYGEDEKMPPTPR